MIFKIWNGDLGLMKTFWGGFVFLIACNIILTITGLSYSAFVHRLILTPFMIFVFVSIWRSADKYEGNKGNARGAKGFVILWSIMHILGLLFPDI